MLSGPGSEFKLRIFFLRFCVPFIATEEENAKTISSTNLSRFAKRKCGCQTFFFSPRLSLGLCMGTRQPKMRRPVRERDKSKNATPCSSFRREDGINLVCQLSLSSSQQCVEYLLFLIFSQFLLGSHLHHLQSVPLWDGSISVSLRPSFSKVGLGTRFSAPKMNDLGPGASDRRMDHSVGHPGRRLGRAQVRPSEPRNPSSVRGWDDIAESPTSPRKVFPGSSHSFGGCECGKLALKFSALSATVADAEPVHAPEGALEPSPMPLRPIPCRRPRRTRPALLGMIWWRSWDSSPTSSPASSSRTMAP
jgi:hypothetical protein